MSIRFVILCGLAICSVSTSFSQVPARGAGEKAALVYSGSESLLIDTPAGWILDSEAGRQDGPIAVMYRKGTTWQTSEPVMYVSEYSAKGSGPITVNDVVKADVEKWGAALSELVVTEGVAVKTAGGQIATVRKFQSVREKHYEAVAYFQGARRVWLLVLAARTSADYDAAYPDFLKWIKSYAPGPTVEVQKH
jgi:hypothetical protein